jgi:hypothetical protein
MTEKELIEWTKKIASQINGEFIEDEVPLEGEPASIIITIEGYQFVLGVLPL